MFRFAGKLKEIANDLYGTIEKNNEGRRILQELADDLKKWDPLLFTNYLKRQMAEYILYEGVENARIVVDDMRFMHEFEALKESGFTIIGVTCDEDIRRGRIQQLYPDTEDARMEHGSETGWKDMPFDYWIKNNGYDGIVGLRDILYTFEYDPEKLPHRVPVYRWRAVANGG